MNLVLFTYDRPHWKTERLLHELVSIDRRPCLIVAAPWKQLNLPPSVVLTVKHRPRHPEVWAKRYGIPYVVCDHETVGVRGADLGIIGGARILPRATIDWFKIGILNLHPGRIPDNRGLSNITRALRDGLPQYVTAHLIDERVDAGRIVLAKEVSIETGDTIYDLGERIMDIQVEILECAIGNAEAGNSVPVPEDCGGYAPPLSYDEELEIVQAWEPK